MYRYIDIKYIYRSNTPTERGGFNGYAVIPPTPLGPSSSFWVSRSFREPLGALPGALRGCLGSPWGLLGSPRRGSRVSLGRLGRLLGVPWGGLGSLLGALRGFWEALGSLFEHLGRVCRASWEYVGVFLGDFLGSKGV